MKIHALVNRTLIVPAILLPNLLGAEDGFRLFTKPLEIPERGEVTSCVVIAGGKRFSFVPPERWSMKPDAVKKTVNLLPEDFGAGIRFKILPGQNEEQPELKAEQLRQQILERFPGARIVNEFKCFAGEKEGLAFDFERLAEKETPVSCRLAFVAFRGGMVEFELITSTKKFTNYQPVFGCVLTSFLIRPVAVAE